MSKKKKMVQWNPSPLTPPPDRRDREGSHDDLSDMEEQINDQLTLWETLHDLTSEQIWALRDMNCNIMTDGLADMMLHEFRHLIYQQFYMNVMGSRYMVRCGNVVFNVDYLSFLHNDRNSFEPLVEVEISLAECFHAVDDPHCRCESLPFNSLRRIIRNNIIGGHAIFSFYDPLRVRLYNTMEDCHLSHMIVSAPRRYSGTQIQVIDLKIAFSWAESISERAQRVAFQQLR